MSFELISQWAHLGLEWVGFGTIVGLIAKAVMPGKDGGGALATVILGILGSVVGLALLGFFSGAQVTPISILGFLVALAGTSLLLVTYRLLGGGAGLWTWLPKLKRGGGGGRKRAAVAVVTTKGTIAEDPV